MRLAAVSQEEFPQHYPESGWVEHDPGDIWVTTAGTCRQVIERAGIDAAEIAAIGITNQRETTIVWDRATGQPVHNAIVWQDRRTADHVRDLREAGHEPAIIERTGLLLDPYFSGTKLKWILDNVDGARARAEAGELLFGTVDCYLIWRLTGGAVHATDATNAARTLLYDIRKGRWSTTMCEMLGIPMAMLPEVRDCAADFGTTRADLFGARSRSRRRRRPAGGDGGAGLLCARHGEIHLRHRLLRADEHRHRRRWSSRNRLLTTIAYQLDGSRPMRWKGRSSSPGRWCSGCATGCASSARRPRRSPWPSRPIRARTWCWCRPSPGWARPTGMPIAAARSWAHAQFRPGGVRPRGAGKRGLPDPRPAGGDGRRLEPWRRRRRGATLRVDGGMSASDWAMQFLADILGAQVDRPQVLETTALGAAWLAGMRAGLYPAQDEFAKTWALDRRFTPDMAPERRATLTARWQSAVSATLEV